jgi:hypothetical protein
MLMIMAHTNEKKVTKAMEVANPIYDAVFKYLMEDDRVARTILSALLKKEVLSVFDQSKTNADTNDHTIFIDEDRYPEDNAEMQRILRRLLMAAVSSDIRQDMNVEDEYYSYLEQKETEVMIKEKIIAQKDAQLSQQKEQLSQKEAQLRASIKMLLDAGLPPAKVAESLGIDVADI